MAGKRTAGEGTAIAWDVAKQLYYQRIGFTDKTGKYRVKAIYGKTTTEVKEKRKTWQKQHDAGINVDACKKTFEKWLTEDWLEIHQSNSVKKTSYQYCAAC